MRTIGWVNGIGRLTGPELYALDHAADRIGTTGTNLASCEGFESGGTFNPAIINRAGSGAVGVIQFMPSTAKALGTSAEHLAEMTFIQQQEYVVRYFNWFKGKNLSKLEDLYCAIFWPAAIGKPDDYVIGQRDSAVYRQNSGFDKAGNRDGIITKGEVCAAIRRYRATGDDKPQIEIPDPDGGDTPPFTAEELNAVRALQEKTTQIALDEFAAGSPFPDEEPVPATEKNS